MMFLCFIWCINTTDLLLSNNNNMVSTRILSINSSYVHSQLEFTLFEIVTLVNVWCNRVMITITNGGKSILLYFVTLSLFKYNFCKSVLKLKQLTLQSMHFATLGILHVISLYSIQTENILLAHHLSNYASH